MDISQEPKWYVMRAFNNKATTAVRELQRCNIEYYLPMKQSIRRGRNGVDQRVTTPLLPSWIFIKTTYSTIQTLNRTIDYLFPIYDRTLGTKNFGVAMTIPSEDMEIFMEFVQGNSDNVTIIDDHSTLDLKRGERVRVTSGDFKGRIATFISVKGKRSKQIVVKIEGFIAVMASTPFTVERI